MSVSHDLCMHKRMYFSTHLRRAALALANRTRACSSDYRTVVKMDEELTGADLTFQCLLAMMVLTG